MVRWLRWHCPPDTGFEIRALAVWGRARYLSVTEAPHNTDFHTWMRKKHFCFFQTAETGNRTPNSGVKGSGANHYPRAPAHCWCKACSHWLHLLVLDWLLFCLSTTSSCVLLAESPSQLCTNMHYWLGNPVSRVCTFIIDKVSMSIVHYIFIFTERNNPKLICLGVSNA